MRGHITKRGKNSYTIVLSKGYDPVTGKRLQQWISVKGTKKDAERRLSELLHQMDTGTLIKPGKVTLAEFLDRWLHDYAWPNLSPRTVEGYEHIIERHIVPSLGSIPLARVKPEHIQRYYSEKLTSGRIDGRGGLSPRTVRHHHVTLHDAFQNGVRWGLLARNPADAVEPPSFQSPEIRTLDEENIATFLEAARSTPYYPLFYLALYTGMRRSEILALRWSDVDLYLCQISVVRTLHHLRDGSLVFRAPKTAKSRRLVALPPSATLVLRDHQERQRADYAMLGRILEDDDLVFSRPDGSPLLPGTVTHAWVTLARRVGLNGIRLHDARHSHASLMLKQGIHPKVVQERLGHASIQITLDTYSHVSPGLQEAAAARFDEGLAPRYENGPVEGVAGNGG